MQTERSAGLPAENFSLARIRRNLLGTSDVGVMVLNRQATDSNLYNRSFGFDANIRPFRNGVINAYIASSEATDTTSDGNAARLSFGYRDAFWNTSAMWKRVSEHFDPGMGFIRRRAMEETYGTVGIHARPRLRAIQEVNPYVELDYVADLSHAMESRTASAGLELYFQPDGQLSLQLSDQFDRVDAAFSIFSDVTIDTGSYAYREGTVKYQSGQGRALFGNVSLSGGDFYNGTRRTVGGGLTWRARYDLSIEGTYTRNDVRLPQKEFQADVAGLRVRYAWSTRLLGSAYVQYNTQTNSYVTNARINFRYAPLSDVFLVYTERRDTSTRDVNERTVALKVTRMFAF